MKRFLIGVLSLTVVSCVQGTPLQPSASGPDAASGRTLTANPSVPHNFRAHLSGDQEVPARDTLAQGQAIFQLSPDGLELSFRLIASNIENVVASHIHIGAPGVNGPVVAFLYGSVPPGGGRTDGVLATGSFGVGHLTGPLTGQPLSALIAAMEAGNAYVNVHTNDGVAPANTGPGDFPGGEIRGQIF